MFPSARFGDVAVGFCKAHESTKSIVATIINGSPDVTTNNVPQAHMTDVLISTCGHPTTIMTGSSTVLTNTLPHARQTDQVIGPPTGSIITGSSNVISG